MPFGQKRSFYQQVSLQLMSAGTILRNLASDGGLDNSLSDSPQARMAEQEQLRELLEADEPKRQQRMEEVAAEKVVARVAKKEAKKEVKREEREVMREDREAKREDREEKREAKREAKAKAVAKAKAAMKASRFTGVYIRKNSTQYRAARDQNQPETAAPRVLRHRGAGSTRLRQRGKAEPDTLPQEEVELLKRAGSCSCSSSPSCCCCFAS
jgi:hypothetical protein